MGCDIHMWAEIKRAKRSGKTEWDCVGHEFVNPWRREEGVAVQHYWDDGVSDEWNSPMICHPYSDRNYSLFAILANVRNGYGFAGVDTGDGFVPISDPRGFPEDLGEFLTGKFKREGIEHTPTWLGLDELVAYDWHGQTTTRRGDVWLDQFKRFREDGKPESWAGWCSGTRVSHEQMDAMLRDGSDDPAIATAERCITSVEWQETYYECCSTFVDETIPALQAIRSKEGVEDLRIIFYFDS